MISIPRIGAVLGVVALFAFAITTFLGRSRLLDDLPASRVELRGEHVPDVDVERADGSTVAVTELVSEGVNLILFLSISDCLVCQAELALWGEIANRHANFRIVPVGVGGDRNIYREFADSELPGFELVFDDHHAVLTSLGASPVTPTRVLLDGIRVVAVSHTRSGDSLLGITRNLIRGKEDAMPPAK